jgi:hypothetical protein
MLGTFRKQAGKGGLKNPVSSRQHSREAGRMTTRTGGKGSAAGTIWLILAFSVAALGVVPWFLPGFAGGEDRLVTQSSIAQQQAKNRQAPGKLTEIKPRVFRSTAGLVYEPGSADGHRLDHVLKHAKNDSGKPVHGVFSGNRDQILALIDTAWLKAGQGGSGVKKTVQNQRLVVTVDMRKSIGYVGGTTGNQRGNPECRLLRIVVEEPDRVVTAYPVDKW